METFRSYAESVPSVPSSESSNGDLAEFDMAGDVRAKNDNFFNPPSIGMLLQTCNIECSRAEERSIDRYVSDGGDVTDPGDEFGSECSIALMELGRCIRTVQSDVDINFLTPVSDLQQEYSLFQGAEGEGGVDDDDDDDDYDDDGDSDADSSMRKSLNSQAHQAVMSIADLVGGGKGSKSSQTLKSR